MMLRRKFRGSIIVPLLVITVGVLFLLSNLGLLTRDLWTVFGRLWPVLIIALGVEFILGDRTLRDALAVIVSLLVVVGIGMIAAYLFGPSDWFYRGQDVSETIGDAGRAEVLLRGGIGAITIDESVSEGMLLEATLAVRLDERIEKSVWRTTGIEETVVRVELGAFGWLPEWRFRPGGNDTIVWKVHLTPWVPMDLTVRSAGGADLDLAAVQLTSLELDLEAGGGRIDLPPGSYEAIVRAQGDVVDISLPSGSAFEIAVLSDTDGSRWQQVSLPGGYSVSEDGVGSPNGIPSADASLLLDLQERDVRVRISEREL